MAFPFSCGHNGQHETSDCPKISSNKEHTGAKIYVASLHKPSKSYNDEASYDSDSDLYNSVESYKNKRSRRKTTKKRGSFAKKRKAHDNPYSDENNSFASTHSYSSDE